MSKICREVTQCKSVSLKLWQPLTGPEVLFCFLRLSEQNYLIFVYTFIFEQFHTYMVHKDGKGSFMQPANFDWIAPLIRNLKLCQQIVLSNNWVLDFCGVHVWMLQLEIWLVPAFTSLNEDEFDILDDIFVAVLLFSTSRPRHCIQLKLPQVVLRVNVFLLTILPVNQHWKPKIAIYDPAFNCPSLPVRQSTI